MHRDVHLSIAVDLDFRVSSRPVIRDADGKRLRLIAREIRDLAVRAQAQAAHPRRGARWHVHDHEPGPVRHATSRCRSSTSRRSRSSRPTASRSVPAWSRDPTATTSSPSTTSGCSALTWDHRAFDGAYAAAFLSAMREQIEQHDWKRSSSEHDGPGPLRVRWLGRVPYADGDALQRALHDAATTTTCCCSSTRTSTRSAPRADLRTCWCRRLRRRRARAHRPRRRRHVPRPGAARRVPDRHAARVARRHARRRRVRPRSSRRVLDRRARRLRGRGAARRSGSPGVWVGDEKIAAIGVKVARGRTRHGFALNVDPDLAMFDHIVPCGIARTGRHVAGPRCSALRRRCATVVDTVAARFAERLRVRRASRRQAVSDARHAHPDVG